MSQETPGDKSEPQKKEKSDLKQPPDKSNPDEIYKFVAKRISGPAFRNPLKNFIDENCITFIDVDENTFEQGQLFKELNQLLENLLDEVLKEGELTQEDFLKAAEKGTSDPKYKKYFNQVINFGDYNFFKSIMTKRNYQIIKMAEKQMENAQKMEEEGKQEGGDGKSGDEKTKELVAKLLEEERQDYNEAIKQSLEEEDRRRRIAAIEEEELRRALKNSLVANPQKEEPEIKKEEPKKEEPKKEEPKKEEPKKEEPKKEEKKKIVPNVISSVSNFQFEAQARPEKKEEQKKEINIDNQPQNKFILESSNTNIQIDSNPYTKNPFKKPEPESNPYKKEKDEEKKDIKPKEEKPKNEIKPEIKDKNEIKPEAKPKEDKKENDNIDIKPKKEERITRDFVNVFEEKKNTLKPITKNPKPNIENDNNKGPGKSSLLKDLQRKKKNIKDDIELMNIKNKKTEIKQKEKEKEKQKEKEESATDVIKKNLEKDKQNNNDIINLDDDFDDGGGLLIDDDEGEKKNEYVSKHNIHFGKIEIPTNFNGKIPEYTKEKQEELKEYRNMVVKNKINDRENDFDDEI